MKIAIDIDGTLCWNNLPVFLNECNEKFKLKIDPSTLATIQDQQEFYALQEIQSRRAENEFLYDELSWMQYRKKCILQALLIDNAVEGVVHLAQLGSLEYYTARYCSIIDIQNEIKFSTRKWLKIHSFPKHRNIIFCNGIHAKVSRLSKIINHDVILLVDDSFRSIIKEIEFFKGTPEYNLFCEKLLLVAICAEVSELPPTDLNVIALPEWNKINDIMGRINIHARQTSATTTSKYATTCTSTGNTAAKTDICSRHAPTATR
jgi:uncharacterized HAD superfamily protein